MDSVLRAIDGAGDEGLLAAAVTQAAEVLAQACRARRPALEVSAAWSDVLRHAVASAARLVSAPPGVRWTWLVSGSVARGEAAPGSDVETLLVLDDLEDHAGDQTRDDVLQRAAAVHAMLDRCGVGGDANGVLASRPRFCRSMTSWMEGVHGWTVDPDRDRGVVMIGLLADAAPASARSGSGVALRDLVVGAVQSSRRAQHAFVSDATSLRAHFPSRLKIVATQSDVVDLKRVAVDPVVKVARWAALTAGSNASDTPDRLRAAARAGTLDADDADVLRECFAWTTRLRWRLRMGWFAGHRPVSDTVLLSELGPQDRAALRGVAREVAGIGRKLRYVHALT